MSFFIHRKMPLYCLLFPILVSCLLEAKEYDSISVSRIGMQTVYGLVSPLDQEGKHFYVRNLDGLIEVKLREEAQVGLLFRERNIKEMLERRKVEVRSAGKEFSLPKRLYLKVYFKDWKTAEQVMKSGTFRDGFLYAKPLPHHLPTKEELWLSGELDSLEPGHITPVKVVKVGDRVFKGSTSGFNYSEQIAGLLDHNGIQPFLQQASVYGKMEGEVFMADYVFLRPIPDQVAMDDPKLPRYLFIGDSISGNYENGLRSALKGKFNIHHPPTNCGPSSKGKNSMQAWLGDYKQKGRHWDVISFNFGHWDAGQTKEVYQANLRSCIGQLLPTNAKLLWVTTCPVPNGYDPAGELGPDQKATGRTAGVMKQYLNPWALEVIQHYPQISICDQWQFCRDNADTLYKDWWAGMNVHFKGEPADALGRFLAKHVEQVMEQDSAE